MIVSKRNILARVLAIMLNAKGLPQPLSDWKKIPARRVVVCVQCVYACRVRVSLYRATHHMNNLTVSPNYSSINHLPTPYSIWRIFYWLLGTITSHQPPPPSTTNPLPLHTFLSLHHPPPPPSTTNPLPLHTFPSLYHGAWVLSPLTSSSILHCDQDSCPFL